MSHLRCRSKTLADHLFESCCSSPEDLERIAVTGQLLPAGSLKFKAVRSKLAWVRHLPGQRFFTGKRVREALEQLVRSHDLSLPNIPGFSLESWIRQQTTSLTKTLQRARKSTAAMDPSLAETQTWEVEDRIAVLCACVFLDSSFPIKPPSPHPQDNGVVLATTPSKACSDVSSLYMFHRVYVAGLVRFHSWVQGLGLGVCM